MQNAVKAGAAVSGLTGIGPTLALGSMGFNNTSALFEMLRTKTSGRIIQAPQWIALDNEEATIQVGELVRYAESFVANTEGGGNVSGFREAGEARSGIKLGLQLLIIPHVTGPENNVLMTIIPKTENFSLDRSGTGGAPPGFRSASSGPERHRTRSAADQRKHRGHQDDAAQRRNGRDRRLARRTRKVSPT